MVVAHARRNKRTRNGRAGLDSGRDDTNDFIKGHSFARAGCRGVEDGGDAACLEPLVSGGVSAVPRLSAR